MGHIPVRDERVIEMDSDHHESHILFEKLNLFDLNRLPALLVAVAASRGVGITVVLRIALTHGPPIPSGIVYAAQANVLIEAGCTLPATGLADIVLKIEVEPLLAPAGGRRFSTFAAFGAAIVVRALGAFLVALRAVKNTLVDQNVVVAFGAFAFSLSVEGPIFSVTAGTFGCTQTG